MTSIDRNDRKHDEAQQVDEPDRARVHNESQQTDEADRSRTRNETQQVDEPDVRAEEARTPETRTTGVEDQAPVAARTRLFEETEAEQYRMQWRELQSNFVDEPRAAVREAETLVSQMMETLTAQLNEQKRALEGNSDAGDTEQLRVVLQRYRSLFDQMLQV
jgi:hypothetical protein